MSEATIFYIALFSFVVAMIANAVAFVRQWRMMRVMKIVLQNLEETQRQFNELYEGNKR